MIQLLWRKKELLTDLLVFLFIYLFLLSYFKPGLLFLKTTICGGDTGSHYINAVYLKEVLLPQGKIMGWMPGNYAGFPLFYYYFPLPFILAVLFSYLIPLEISFKLITVLGTFLLPLCLYFSFRALKYDFPAPILAALFSLVFLFNQGHSMWGGNIPSTLAGEFCFSLAMALAFLFLGTLYRGVKEQKRLLLNAVLIFLVGLSHAYGLIFCLLLGGYFLLTGIKNNWRYLLGVYGLGFILLSFWLLPVLADLTFTTQMTLHWTIGNLWEVLPPILLPLLALSLAAFWLKRRDARTGYFAYTVLVCGLVYLIGPRIGILDVRFVPFLQLLLAIFGAAWLPDLFKGWRMNFILPIILLLAVILGITSIPSYIPGWIEWNYQGYETKPAWPVLKGITGYLRQSGGGRVEWEHTPLDEPLGSIRTSEMLPYFAGRETLEGIHLLGTPTAPFVYYIESETSIQPCNPLPRHKYSSLNLKNGIEHFKLFNVSHFVVRSAEVKRAIRAYREFRLEKTIGDYNIYRLLTNSGQYVEPLKNQPVRMRADNWKNLSYEWFLRPDLKDVFLFFTNDKSAGSSLKDIKPVPYPDRQVKVTSRIYPEKIEIETSEIGYPLLIKVSYHPNWRVKGAERIYLASPSFMLVYPTEKKVTLTFKQWWQR